VITSVHQPHFLPWISYVNKVVRSDVFVWLDTVQYRKNYFQNRTVIRTPMGAKNWLTLPVHAPFGTAIADVKLAEPGWRDRVRKMLEQDYGRAPFFRECWPPIRAALEDSNDSLVDVNCRSLEAVLRLLGVEVRLLRASQLGADAEDPTDRLVAICRAVGARRYIAGRGGRNYLRVDTFDRAGIEILWQQCEPSEYPQSGPGFLPGLSVVDCLFNVGPAEARRLVELAWQP
jgi:WbqC-like protein family